MILTVQELARKLDAEFFGDADKALSGVAPLEQAGPDDLSFAAGDRWLRMLKPGCAGAVILKENPGMEGLNVILHPDPQLAFAKAVRLFYPLEKVFTGISPLSHIDDSAVIGDPVTIEPFVQVGADSVVGSRVVLAGGVKIGKGCVIGDDVVLRPNVVVEDRCVIGNNVIIHAGTVIGADGFGYLQRDGKNVKIPQVGKVVIGNNVEIGANVCVDRGAIGDTVIGNDVVIDNQVQIAHNVRIGDGVVIVAHVALAGSASIGDHAILAGKVGVVEHKHVGEGAVVAARTLVTKDIKPGEFIAGNPPMPIEQWRKIRIIEKNLPRYWPQIIELLNKAEKE